MTTLSAKELSDMRDVADDFFPDTCTIQALTTTVGAQGGVSETYADSAVDVACRLDPGGSGDERIRSFALEGHSVWWLNIPYTQDIAVTDRIRTGGKQYEVKLVVTDQSFNTIHRAIVIRKGAGAFTDKAFSNGFDTGFS